MLHSLIRRLDSRVALPVASAHCDIPCKIYDPISAQIAALTVIRMMDLIQELAAKDSLNLEEQAQFGRLVAEKEAHALKVKDEVRVIWGDYFKQPQFDQIAGVHDLVHGIMLAGSKCKQKLDPALGDELLGLVNQFADAFWKTKGVDTYKAVCPYPPSREVVYPKLG